MRPRLGQGLAGLAIALAIPAHASLIGDTVGCSITPPIWACNPSSATVIDPGSEFQLVLDGPYFAVDIGPSSMTLTWISGGSLGMGAGELATFTGLTGAGGVAGFSSTGESGFDLSDVSLSAGTLTLVLDGSNWDPQASATIRFETVPEPGSLALLGLAFLGLAAPHFRKQS